MKFERLRSKRWLFVCWLLVGVAAWWQVASLAPAASAQEAASSAETKAIAFLVREVPAWPKENGCFSCHNNGDAARALYVAAARGYRVPPAALAATSAWLNAPLGWDENKGDPGFSDKRLADVQFAVALLTGLETGQLRDAQPLQAAAQKLLAQQSRSGAWEIDAGNTLGSPATYGTPLATWQAWRVLEKAQAAASQPARQTEMRAAQQRALQFLRQLKPVNVPQAATLLLALGQTRDAEAEKLRGAAQRFLQRAQTRDGGWGPYADAPPEVFDTALALLALAETAPTATTRASLQRGRQFLIAQQNADGSWPATTRPSGNISYAQLMSTTGWATLALFVGGS